MSLFLDLLLVAVFAVTVWTAYKRGFFKSVMSFVSVIASVLVAYTFTPALSVVIREKLIHSSLTSALAETVASLADAGAEAAENTVYDLTALADNTQFESIVNKYGADMEAVGELIIENSAGGYDAVEKIASAVTYPVANTLATVVAFAVCYIVTLVLLKIFTLVIGSLFKLPVLSTMDRGLGIVFGVITAFIAVYVIAMVAEPCLTALSAVLPGIVTEDMFENSIILKFFADYNLLSMIKGIVD